MTKLNSIGIAKKPKDTLIVVAMSGGVDSSTVAAIMKNEGYNIIGITLKLYNDNKDWGIGQVQSIINGKVTINFENVGKKVINSQIIKIEKFINEYRRD